MKRGLITALLYIGLSACTGTIKERSINEIQVEKYESLVDNQLCLGDAWLEKKDYRRALGYYQKARRYVEIIEVYPKSDGEKNREIKKSLLIKITFCEKQINQN